MLTKIIPLRNPRPTYIALILVTLLAIGALMLTSGSGLLPAARPNGAASLGRMPLAFEANAGQLDPTVRYQAHIPGGTLYFTPDSVVLSLPQRAPASPGAAAVSPAHTLAAPMALGVTAGAATADPLVLQLRFIGAGQSEIAATEQLPGVVNYLYGNDPAGWISGIKTYARLDYQALYPGIDLHYDGSGAQLKGTYIVQPGADPRQIRWQYSGVGATLADVHLDTAGNLQIRPAGSAADRAVSEAAPVAWQEHNGQRSAVAVSYAQASDGSISFVLGSYDPSLALTLDPALDYSSYLGSPDEDHGQDIALDSAGNTYLTGYTNSPLKFPLADPVLQANNQGGFDIFVTKLNAAGNSLVYSTYLGGSADDKAYGIAVDSSGSAYLSGATNSTDFPVRNAIQSSSHGLTDGFVTKLTPAGDKLVYSTYLGGNGNDAAQDIALDGDRNAYLVGSTDSTANFPLLNSLQSLNRGGSDAFAASLYISGTLQYSTYYGGTDNDYGAGIAVDSAGNAFLTGTTQSTNFPLSHPYQSLLKGSYDAFVVKLKKDDTIIYSTFLGGSDYDDGQAIAVDGSGAPYITGSTQSDNFPVSSAGVIGPSKRGRDSDYDAFVTKLKLAGNALAYSTYLGGSDVDEGRAIAVDRSNSVYVAGATDSALDFPLFAPVQKANHGSTDAFVSKINGAATALLYSSYLGGSDVDAAQGIALDVDGNIHLAGSTASTDFPLRAPFQATNGGGFDAFAVKIDVVAAAAPTAIPGFIADGAGPKADGAIAVWEDDTAGNWDIYGRDLATGVDFIVYQGASDQRHPAVSGNLVVWQDQRNGDWDIYGSYLNGDVAGTPFAIYRASGDQQNPAVRQDIVLWQSTATGSTRADIAGIKIGFSAPFTLTTAATTNANPALDVDFSNSSSGSDTTAVWQSTTPTQTLAAGATSSNWQIVGARSVAGAAPSFITITSDALDHTNPAISGNTVVWQQYITPTWRIAGSDLTASTNFTVTDGVNNQINPSIRGSTVVYQDAHILDDDAPDRHGRWTVMTRDLLQKVTKTISTLGPVDAIRPIFSGTYFVWQQSPAAPRDGQGTKDEGIDIFGTIRTTNFAPSATVSLLPAPPQTNSTLVAAASTTDQDNDPVTLTYVWKVTHNGNTSTVRTAAGTSALSDTLDLSLPGNGDKNDLVSVEVVPNDVYTDGVHAASSVTVGNTPPTAADGAVSTSHGNAAGIDIPLSANDADGDSLSYSLVNANGGALHGTVTISGTVAHYVPAGNFVGSDDFQWRAGDGTASSAGATITVDLTNDLPSAAVTLSPNQPGTNSILTASAVTADNDSDALTLTYVWLVVHDGITSTVKTTSNTSALSDTLDLSMPGHGDRDDAVVVQVVPDDSYGAGPAAAARKTIVNSLPAISAGGPYAMTEGSTLTLDAGHPTDPDGDPLSFGWDVNGDGDYPDVAGPNPTLSWTKLQSLGIVDGPAHLSKLQLRVSDGRNIAISSYGFIEVGNSPPVAAVSGPTNIFSRQPVTFTLTATDASLPDQQAGFSYRIDWNGDGVVDQAISPAAVSGIGVAHSYSQAGNYTIILTARDRNAGQSVAATLAITVTNQPPSTPTATNTPTFTRTPTRTPVITKTPTRTPTPVVFSDVLRADYFYQAVYYLAARGIVSGYADGTFRPYNFTTRSQLAKIIVGAEGWPINSSGGPHFDDVPTSSAFYGFIETAFNHHVLSGYSDHSFRPFDNVTRGQLSKIVVNAEGWALLNPRTPTFRDVVAANPFYREIETAAAKQIISGYVVAPGIKEFRWGNNATRGQIAKIVYGAMQTP